MRVRETIERVHEIHAKHCAVARLKARSRLARILNCFSQGRKKMAAERSYDAIVIGAGQGGKPLSMVLAKAGLKTAVVEERYVGGSCVNYG
jgi:heterodisulfide reductase subunit A-like polyferredoxin